MAADEGGDGSPAVAEVIENVEGEEGQVPAGDQEFADDAAVEALATGPNPDPLPSENYKEDLTMTDHLNKSLLQSFLSRINMPGSDVPVSEAIDTNEEQDGHGPPAAEAASAVEES